MTKRTPTKRTKRTSTKRPSKKQAPPTRIDEAEMAKVVKTILTRRKGYRATFAELREIVPLRVRLSEGDTAKSPSRPGEELWMQIIRNLSSHEHDGFVSIKGGGLRLKGYQPRTRAAAPENRVSA